MPLPVEPVAIEGVWWRQIQHRGDPLWRSDPPSDNRWQRSDIVEALYFADSDETVWAEWYRALAEFAVPPDRQTPRDLWQWQISIEGIADLSNEQRLVAVGLTPPSPSQRTWLPFQDVGEALWREGYAGILYPSAARPAHRSLCLFREGTTIAGIEPLRPPATYRDPPPPPTGMVT